MANSIQIRRDTSDRWAALNPVLSEGEPGYNLETRELKIGDGVNPWEDLPGYKIEDSAPYPTPVSSGSAHITKSFGNLYNGLVYPSGPIIPNPDKLISPRGLDVGPHPTRFYGTRLWFSRETTVNWMGFYVVLPDTYPQELLRPGVNPEDLEPFSVRMGLYALTASQKVAPEVLVDTGPIPMEEKGFKRANIDPITLPAGGYLVGGVLQGPFYAYDIGVPPPDPLTEENVESYLSLFDSLLGHNGAKLWGLWGMDFTGFSSHVLHSSESRLGVHVPMVTDNGPLLPFPSGQTDAVGTQVLYQLGVG